MSFKQMELQQGGMPNDGSDDVFALFHRNLMSTGNVTVMGKAFV
jgi:hypothetical protein